MSRVEIDIGLKELHMRVEALEKFMFGQVRLHADIMPDTLELFLEKFPQFMPKEQPNVGGREERESEGKAEQPNKPRAAGRTKKAGKRRGVLD